MAHCQEAEIGKFIGFVEFIAPCPIGIKERRGQVFILDRTGQTRRSAPTVSVFYSLIALQSLYTAAVIRVHSRL